MVETGQKLTDDTPPERKCFHCTIPLDIDEEELCVRCWYTSMEEDNHRSILKECGYDY